MATDCAEAVGAHVAIGTMIQGHESWPRDNDPGTRTWMHQDTEQRLRAELGCYSPIQYRIYR